MAHKVSSQTAEHYAGGILWDRWQLWKKPGLSIIQERVGVGCTGIRPRQQPAHQFFYVLQGLAELEVDGHEVLLKQQEGCCVPMGTPHRLRNGGSEDVVFLVISGGDVGETDFDQGTRGIIGLVKPGAAAT